MRRRVGMNNHRAAVGLVALLVIGTSSNPVNAARAKDDPGPEDQHVSTRLDRRDQVSYSSLSALLALRRRFQP